MINLVRIWIFPTMWKSDVCFVTRILRHEYLLCFFDKCSVSSYLLWQSRVKKFLYLPCHQLVNKLSMNSYVWYKDREKVVKGRARITRIFGNKFFSPSLKISMAFIPINLHQSIPYQCTKTYLPKLGCTATEGFFSESEGFLCERAKRAIWYARQQESRY